MQKPDKIQKSAITVTRWIGSPQSIMVHTVIFALGFVAVPLHLLPFDTFLLILTTIVSLEAIYLALFIQMTVNYQAADIEDIQEDIDEMQEDVGEIQKDVDELQEDVEEISEDVEEMTEDEKIDEKREADSQKALGDIQRDLQKLMADIAKLQQPK